MWKMKEYKSYEESGVDAVVHIKDDRTGMHVENERI